MISIERRPARRSHAEPLKVLLLAGSVGLAWPGTARSQFIGEYFPTTVPGYQREPGTAADATVRRSYDPLGVRVGSFMVHSDLLESTGYNSNVAGFSNTPGSWLLRTAPSLSIDSDWSRNRVGAAFTADDTRYFSTPSQNYTDWTATLGGAYTIGRSEAVLGYSHLSLHEDPTQIGSVISSTPIPYQVDDLRLSYAFLQGRFTITPRIDVQLFRFGDATLFGVPVSEQFQNRVVTKGEIETRYALSDQRSLVFVVRGISSQYIDEPAGESSQDSTSFLALGGIDYQASAVWRYRLLAGVEHRSFSASQYASHTAPIVEASAIWYPTGLTTVTGILSRTIEDPAAAGTGGYTYTRGRLIVDHEYLRNVFLQGHFGFETAEYLQAGGTQSNVSFGAGVRWLLNRNVQLSLDYSFARQDSPDSGFGLPVPTATAALPGTSFTRSLILLSLRLSL